MATIIAFVLGLGIGLVLKHGIKIDIQMKEPKAPEVQHKAVVEAFPEQMRQYAETHRGHINF